MRTTTDVTTGQVPGPFGAAKIDRYVSPEPLGSEHELEQELGDGALGLRPTCFADYPGQTFAKENLRVYVQAALARQKPMDHVILHGPPGLGKTTLAHIIAHELHVQFYNTSGPSIDRPGDLVGILAGMEAGALLFIDEIHRLSVQVEEVLYSAMEDFSVDIVVGQGAAARSIRMPLKPFTLVGATTKLSNLSRPFLNRFGIQEKLDFYDRESLVTIINRGSRVLGMVIDSQGAHELARRSRGTPRIALRLLRRVWDFAQVLGKMSIDQEAVDHALARLDIDDAGLDRTDREILRTIVDKYQGGPVGIETLAITLGEERSTLEEVYEPFLVFSGFIGRGPRGRMITPVGRQHLDGEAIT